ncbi:S1-C subfamily serine protease [Sphingobium subterraneum]|uniref:S1-C subfamily serine protease n=1 Tax=Sphingobium subterraneum TaxID=627688 RepID=A0A841IWZ6_9SPHN|nr:S1-C subfamily serine protease [Sphingobium subterraneum]
MPIAIPVLGGRYRRFTPMCRILGVDRILVGMFGICLAIFPWAAFAHLDVPTPVSVIALPAGTPTRSIQLSRVVSDLRRGDPFGKLKMGLMCVGAHSLKWNTRRGDVSVEDFDHVFRDELKSLGYDVVSASRDLFDSGDEVQADFLVGGTIKSLVVDACWPHSGFGDRMSTKGSALMEVEWQIYDPIQRKVMDRFTTRTGSVVRKPQSDGVEGLVYAAFAENVRALVSKGPLRSYAVGAARDLLAARLPNPNVSPLSLHLPEKGVGTVAGAAAATVLVESATGHGSGFLISSDGYFFTNHHVVGGAKFVKLRWSDGQEQVAQVMRVDKGRDVALLKSPARGRAPLHRSPGTVGVGTEVFAVGAPLFTDLQGTVTKGIISANRDRDGYAFIQSDVSVAPGNSGGPLVTGRGELLGMAVTSVRISDAQQGMNFFIPAADIFRFLAIVAGK